MSELVKHRCPFCGEWIKHNRFCNGFCTCSAKYYSQDQVWLNRKTGETRITNCVEVVGGADNE